jgi:hypothetical protein
MLVNVAEITTMRRGAATIVIGVAKPQYSSEGRSCAGTALPLEELDHILHQIIGAGHIIILEVVILETTRT